MKQKEFETKEDQEFYELLEEFKEEMFQRFLQKRKEEGFSGWNNLHISKMNDLKVRVVQNILRKTLMDYIDSANLSMIAWNLQRKHG